MNLQHEGWVVKWRRKKTDRWMFFWQHAHKFRGTAIALYNVHEARCDYGVDRKKGLAQLKCIYLKDAPDL